MTYALHVLDRAVRTAIQALAGYLVAAHTVGDVDWRTAALAVALAAAVSLLQGLVDLPAVTIGGPWGDIFGRAIRTFAQTALASTASAVLITDIPWSTVLSASALAALTSIATSLIALPLGSREVKGTPALVGPAPARVVA